ncbi:MAG: (2Fe-2S)-binding protein [Oscillatoriales cyanobacterium]|nr:MAG: (2Fe-2S)-binding protein [Oscillatoriales cyanobacterium]
METTTITFWPEGVTVVAEAGEPLLAVADRAGVVIPTGCLMGSCHACEVDLTIEAVLGNTPPTPEPATLAEPQTVCACITGVPAGVARLAVDLSADPTW